MPRVPRVLGLAALVALAVGSLSAATGETTAPAYAVALQESEDGRAWTIETMLRWESPLAASTQAHAWVPAEARLLSAEAFVGNATFVLLPLRAVSEDTLAFELPANATGLRARSVLPQSTLPQVVVPVATSEGVVEVRARPGAPAPDGLAFATRAEAGGRLVHVAELGPRAAGERVSLAAPPREMGPGGWVIVGVAALLTFVIGAAWSRRRVRAVPAPARFLEHFAELQTRLRVVILAFGAFVVAFFALGLSWWAWKGFMVPVPVFSTEGSVSALVFRSFASRLVPEGVTLVATRPMDAVLAQFQVVLLLAFMVVLPLLAYELAVFLGPALAAAERRVATRVVPGAVALFVAGVLFAYFFMVPLILRTLYEYATALDVAPLLAVSEFVGFAAILLLVFGLAFEMPLAMAALSRLGLVAPRTWASKWRHAVVGLFVLAAVVTPDPSVVNQVLIALPLLGLYALGVLAARAATPASG